MPFQMMNDQGLSDLPFKYGEFEAGAQRQNVLDSQTLANLYQQLQNQYQASSNIIRDKEAAFAQDEMNNPQLRDWRMRGMIGKDQSAAAAGQYDQETMNAKVKQGLADLKAKTTKAEYEAQVNEMEKMYTFLDTALPALEGGIPGLETNMRILQLAQENGVDPTTAAKLVQGASGGNIDTLKKLRSTLGYALTQTTGQRQKMQEKELDAVTRIETANIAADASRYGTDARRGDEEKAVNARRLAFQKGSPSVKYTTAMGALESGISPFTGEPMDEAERIMLTKAAKAAAEIMNASNQARQAGNPNVGQMTGGSVPTYPIPQIGGQGTPQGQPKRYNPQTKTWE